MRNDIILFYLTSKTIQIRLNVENGSSTYIYIFFIFLVEYEKKSKERERKKKCKFYILLFHRI